MRIYMAGFHAGRGTSATTSLNFRVSQMVKYPWLLESYHYMDRAMVEEIRLHRRTIFLDSGAFSMFTQGVEVNLKDYAQFIKDHDDIIHVASNLDAIGAGKENISYDNQKLLESYGVKIHPVHHVRDADHWLRRYLDEGYKYIFLGGMVPENTPTLENWLDHMWGHYLTNEDGTPKVDVHGFGLTTLSLMFRYPWTSVDSTSWVMTSRFGAIYLDMPQSDGTIRDYKVDFSDRSTKRYDIESWHFDSLAMPLKDRVVERLEQLEAMRLKSPNHDPETEAWLEKEMGFKQGFNPEALAKSYGWRDTANIEYFRRAMDRRVDKFVLEQETLGLSS